MNRSAAAATGPVQPLCFLFIVVFLFFFSFQSTDQIEGHVPRSWRVTVAVQAELAEARRAAETERHAHALALEQQVRIWLDR